MTSLNTYYRILIVFTVHFILYRSTLFISTIKDFTTEVFFRKFISGFLYDLHYILAFLLLFVLINALTKSQRIIKVLAIILFIFTATLNVVNHYMMGYFSDGLASYGILVEYIADLDTVLKMGAGTFNPAALILFYLPLVLFFIPLPKLEFNFFKLKPYRKLVFVLIFANLFVNQMVKMTRVNKNAPLETNTVIRIVRSSNSTNKMFEEAKKLANTKLNSDNLKLLQTNSSANYISKDFPLLKIDKMPILPFQKKKPNIVLFIFESVGAFQTGIKKHFNESDRNLFKEQKSFTPYFDSLLKDSAVFPNFYAHGTYTSLGQVSMLCSVFDPISALDGKGSIMRNYSGTNLKCLPEYLSEIGYKNLFFNGYHKEFDNKAFFFPKIKINDIYCREEIKTAEGIVEDEHTWGLQDSTVAKFMAKKLKSTSGPFFSTFMSVNTHAPYNHIKNLPKGYSRHDYSLIKTDNAIKMFMNEIKSEPWYDNTIFIFAADNGTSFRMSKVTNKADEDLYYNRIPFIIYSPSKIGPKGVFKSIGSQVDVSPTILNMIGLNKTTNHFVGKSLFSKTPTYALQYKHFNNFFAVPEKKQDFVDRLRKLYMYLIFNNKFMSE